MAITNLALTYQYPDRLTDLPVVLLLHGWSDNMNSLTSDILQRIALRKLFVASIGMRGRNGASGSRDASGREIYDIYDALVWIRANFSNVSQDRAIICGYSGGGGNALAAACKFPDTWCQVVSHFGMSDYGYNDPDGWYYNNEGNKTTEIATSIGGTPASVPNAYRARNAVEAISNYSDGWLYLFHDDQDTSVPIIHSQRIRDAKIAAIQTNYTAYFSTIGDTNRWQHGYPVSTPLSNSENYWALDAATKTRAVWTIPASGTVRVIGYIVTKRFTVWLGDGLSEVASVAYDTVAGSYTVTPLTGEMSATITQGAQTATQTISEETTITL